MIWQRLRYFCYLSEQKDRLVLKPFGLLKLKKKRYPIVQYDMIHSQLIIMLSLS